MESNLFERPWAEIWQGPSLLSSRDNTDCSTSRQADPWWPPDLSSLSLPAGSETLRFPGPIIETARLADGITPHFQLERSYISAIKAILIYYVYLNNWMKEGWRAWPVGLSGDRIRTASRARRSRPPDTDTRSFPKSRTWVNGAPPIPWAPASLDSLLIIPVQHLY